MWGWWHVPHVLQLHAGTVGAESAVPVDQCLR